MRRWRTWQGNDHYRRPPPSLARFLAATRFALKRQQTLGAVGWVRCLLQGTSTMPLPLRRNPPWARNRISIWWVTRRVNVAPESSQRTRQGFLLSNVQPLIRYCMATASLRAPRPIPL
ncbi:hypothetical protein DNK06_12265 [Pseudomonas daroniae]|uniref:Uncharacterized protein n=1 Tax=Phytopseudomonas daroniae TaxID=2487519 RepID=A0A4Q9QMM2_9GAMM|nr:hypothetical protein DNK06_12265 [Pseudomonas daroniae]TBU82435.1 hypothetical protein DNK31_11135 [Pseudomonas sp. FRB 228]TBU91852.1 hypothetical protein DNJ99_09785 [Pseudomonas daroniae]